MFSGIVETLGHIQQLIKTPDAVAYHIQPQLAFTDLKIGDSVAVNGVCLTVTELLPSGFSVTAVPETLRLTNLGALQQGSQVNLERALLVGGRNGGHNVQGHVDSLGSIIAIDEDGKKAWLVKIQIDPALAKYIVNKGFITIDGMSITVIETQENWFTVTLIPHTREVTIANAYQIGSHVNIEVDSIGKYLEKLLAKS